MVTVVHAPKNEMPRIDCIWAFLSVDEEDGNEGVCATMLPNGSMMPLIAADEKRLQSLWPEARRIAQMTGRRCRLVKFHTREVIEEFGGQ
jgi:hypothetical protein